MTPWEKDRRNARPAGNWAGRRRRPTTGGSPGWAAGSASQDERAGSEPALLGSVRALFASGASSGPPACSRSSCGRPGATSIRGTSASPSIAAWSSSVRPSARSSSSVRRACGVSSRVSRRSCASGACASSCAPSSDVPGAAALVRARRASPSPWAATSAAPEASSASRPALQRPPLFVHLVTRNVSRVVHGDTAFARHAQVRGPKRLDELDEDLVRQQSTASRERDAVAAPPQQPRAVERAQPQAHLVRGARAVASREGAEAQALPQAE